MHASYSDILRALAGRFHQLDAAPRAIQMTTRETETWSEERCSGTKEIPISSARKRWGFLQPVCLCVAAPLEDQPEPDAKDAIAVTDLVELRADEEV